MNKVYFFALFIPLYMFIVPGYCQIGNPESEYFLGKKNEIRLEFFHSWTGSFIVDYERHIKKSSFLISVGPTIIENSQKIDNGFHSEFQARFFSRPKRDCAFKGIYVGPFIQYKYLERQKKDHYYFLEGNNNKISNTDIYSSITAGFICGLKLSIVNMISLDFSIGTGMKYTDKSTDYPYTNYDYDDDNPLEPGYSGILPRANFSFGILF
ncbi:MAG: hypothetical protein HY738_23875 [Bacteroidia bacterium]|nr:hypothetical protein [Bacteroidia bacterium]